MSEKVDVDGLAKAVRVWRLVAWSGSRDAQQVPLIGRKLELGQFGNALAACSQDGTGQTLYLRGEAGIGKTRLLEDFRSAAQSAGYACHSVLVLDFGAGRGGDAVRALVRSLLDVPAGGAGARSRADWAVSNGLVDAERALFLNELLELAQPPDLGALYQAMDNSARRRGAEETVALLVSGLAARNPLLISVEDIQWADSIVLEQLAALAFAVSGCRAILLMTARIDGDPLDQTWRASTRGSPLLTLDLAPLGALAATSEDRDTQVRALRQGEEILAKGCVSHNYFSFHRFAMEAALGTGDWSVASRYADALETYTKPEPLPWCEFFIDRTRALVAYGLGAPGEPAKHALRQMRDRGAESGFGGACGAIDEALASPR